MSNEQSIVTEQARKQAKAEFQLLLAQKKVEGCRELEQLAYTVYATAKTDAHLRTWKLMELRLRGGEADEELCRLQLEAVS